MILRMAVRALGRGLKYGCCHGRKKEHNKKHGWDVLEQITGRMEEKLVQGRSCGRQT